MCPLSTLLFLNSPPHSGHSTGGASFGASKGAEGIGRAAKLLLQEGWGQLKGLADEVMALDGQGGRGQGTGG